MSVTSGDSGGAASLSPADAHELARLVSLVLQDPAGEQRGYSESFSVKKTDIAAGTAGAVAASRQILGGDVLAVMGWAVVETTGGATAKIRLRDGNNAQGEVIVGVTLAANESTRDFLTGKGVEVFTGRVFLEVVSGSVEGVLYWR